MNVTILNYAPLLRYLADHGPQAVDARLAEACGKDRSNLKRDLPKLIEAGVIDRSEPNGDTDIVADIALTEAGRRALQGLDLAAGAIQIPDGMIAALHAEIGPRPDLNPRKEFDPIEIDDLRQGILTKGLLQGLVLRPADAAANPVRYWIVAGERRWRAIGEAIADGDWPEDRPIPAKLQPMTDAEHRRLAFAENVQRVQLNPVELARYYQAEIDAGRSTAEIAEDAGKTREHVQQHLRILRLDDATLDQLRDGEITFREARDLVAKPKAEAKAPPPAAEPASFDPTSLQKLIIVELADKVARDPVSKFRSGFTPILPGYEADPDLADLSRLDAIGVRVIDGLHEARISPASPASDWLKLSGWDFDPLSRDDLVRQVRAECGAPGPAGRPYRLAWLNTDDADPAKAAADRAEKAGPAGDRLAGPDLPAGGPREPVQLPLIAPTPGEREEIDAAEMAREREAADALAIERFVEELREEMARLRAGHLANWDSATFPPAALATMAVECFAAGHATRAAAVLVMLRDRCGAIGVQHTLRRAIPAALPQLEAAPCE